MPHLQYWDDPADAIRQQEGTLLPLWSFAAPRARGRAVTALAWSPRYFDLFVAGYGSYQFQAATPGLVACYSLKSPSQPERCFATPAGVLCLDFHPQRPNLLAVGCADGGVLVLDVGAPPPAGGGPAPPLYAATPASGKHTEPVWQVAWQRSDGHELEFVSVSSDGRIALWSVSKNELSCRDLMVLRQLAGSGVGLPALAPLPAAAGSGGGSGAGLDPAKAGQVEGAVEHDQESGAVAGGLCFDFHPAQDYLFVVGTEEGGLFKCSTASTSHYLAAFAGHRLPVYAVRWNSHHARAFLSAGADWSVKLWETLQPRVGTGAGTMEGGRVGGRC